MNNEQKARMYSDLMSKFDFFRNKIADIKLTQVNLTEEQEKEIRRYELQQREVLSQINNLLR